MAQPYPLYDEIVAKLNGEPLKEVNLTKICSTINIICRNHSDHDALEHYREIGALMLHFYILSRGIVPTANNFPYKGKVMAGGKGILTFAKEMPIELQMIISRYISDNSS